MTQREGSFPSVRASEPLSSPPQWAILQRALMDAMNAAAGVVDTGGRVSRTPHRFGALRRARN